jgi:hypothetical protein
MIAAVRAESPWARNGAVSVSKDGATIAAARAAGTSARSRCGATAKKKIVETASPSAPPLL